MIRLYILGGAAIAFAAVLAALWWQIDRNASLRDENNSLTRSVAALELGRDQARIAADVARAEAARQAIAAAEYEQVKDAFRKGDFDAHLPDDFRVLLNRILQPASR